MRELKNGTKIIGVDHGYGNIKTANTIMPTGITAYQTVPTFEGNIQFKTECITVMQEGFCATMDRLSSFLDKPLVEEYYGMEDSSMDYLKRSE